MANEVNIDLESLYQMVSNSEAVLLDWLQSAKQRLEIGKMNQERFNEFCKGLAVISKTNRAVVEFIAKLENEADVPPSEAYRQAKECQALWKERYEKSENRKLFLAQFPQAQIAIYGNLVVDDSGLYL